MLGKSFQIFDTPALAAAAYVEQGGFGEIWQTLRGAVTHCPIEYQEEFVWVVEVENAR